MLVRMSSTAHGLPRVDGVQMAYALQAGRVVTPKEAVRGETLHCLICGGEVIAKRPTSVTKSGRARASHFAHKTLSAATLEGHDAESVAHRAAKLRFAAAVQAGAAFQVRQPCRGRACPETRTFSWTAPSSVAVPEFGWTAGGALYRLDVAVLDREGGSPLLGTEVLKTHAVPEHKAQAFLDQRLPWVEFSADRYLEDDVICPKRPQLNYPATSELQLSALERRNLLAVVETFHGQAEKIRRALLGEVNVTSPFEAWTCPACLAFTDRLEGAVKQWEAQQQQLKEDRRASAVHREAPDVTLAVQTGTERAERLLAQLNSSPNRAARDLTISAVRLLRRAAGDPGDARNTAAVHASLKELDDELVILCWPDGEDAGGDPAVVFNPALPGVGNADRRNLDQLITHFRRLYLVEPADHFDTGLYVPSSQPWHSTPLHTVTGGDGAPVGRFRQRRRQWRGVLRSGNGQRWTDTFLFQAQSFAELQQQPGWHDTSLYGPSLTLKFSVLRTGWWLPEVMNDPVSEDRPAVSRNRLHRREQTGRQTAVADPVLAERLDLAIRQDPLVDSLHRLGRHPRLRDGSAMDFELCTLLAFWLNRDRQKIDQAFRASARYSALWDRMIGDGQETYGQRTVSRALEQRPCSYDPPGLQAAQTVPTAEIAERYGAARAALEQALEAMKGAANFKGPQREALAFVLTLIEQQGFTLQGVNISLSSEQLRAAYRAAERPDGHLDGTLVFMAEHGILGRYLRTGTRAEVQGQVLMPLHPGMLPAVKALNRRA